MDAETRRWLLLKEIEQMVDQKRLYHEDAGFLVHLIEVDRFPLFPVSPGDRNLTSISIDQIRHLMFAFELYRYPAETVARRGLTPQRIPITKPRRIALADKGVKFF